MGTQNLEVLAEAPAREIAHQKKPSRFRQLCSDKMQEYEQDASFLGFIKYMTYSFLEYANRGFRRP